MDFIRVGMTERDVQIAIPALPFLACLLCEEGGLFPIIFLGLEFGAGEQPGKFFGQVSQVTPVPKGGGENGA